MNLLIGSLSKNGKIGYYEDGVCYWQMSMNCPKYITTDGKYYYTYSQGEKLTLYSLEKKGKEFKVRSTILLNDKTCSHLCYSKINNLLFCSCMDSGYYYAVEVLDGIFTELKFSGVPGEKLPSKCHQVVLNKKEDFAVVVNILRDKLYFYKIVNQKFIEDGYMEFKTNTLPRHVMFSYDEKVLYLVTEKSNEIMVSDYKNKKIIQTQPLVPNQVQNAQGATLQIDNDKKILYTCIRGNNLITTFKIKDDYTLEYLYTCNMHGDNCRHMFLSNDKTQLVCFNIKTNNVTFIDVNTQEKVNQITFSEAISGIEVL